MLDIFSGLRLVIKRRNVSIDNAVFRCHWLFTSALLISFSLIITARQYVGQPIECYSVDKIPESLLNSYCWVQSTFSVPQACDMEVGREVPYPCIDNRRGREVKMFAYYQWVGLVLFIQGLLFHMPYYLWKVWENGLIRAVTSGLRLPVMSDQERSKKIEVVVEYIQDHLGCHLAYAYKYFLCEIICLFNLLIQLWAVNRFFDGQFLRYGIDVVQYTRSGGQHQQNTASPNSTLTSKSNRQPLDPMSTIFPRMTKCTYYDFGSSGDVQRHDALCLLPLNIIHEKIYIALWFWFLILTLLTLLVIAYRLLAINNEAVRTKGLVSRCKLSSESDIRLICKHCDVGDWFLFYMVAENLDPIIMREVMASIATKIQQQFQLKEELEMLRQQTETEACEAQELAKLKEKSLALEREQQESRFTQRNPLNHYLLNRQWSFEDRSTPSSRRNSMATTAPRQAGYDDDHVDADFPLGRKLRKRLSTKRRLWSVDLGFSPHLREQVSSQPSSPRARFRQQDFGFGETTHFKVSAPPAHLMPLNSAPLRKFESNAPSNEGDPLDINSDNLHQAKQPEPSLAKAITSERARQMQEKPDLTLKMLEERRESSPTPSKASTARLPNGVPLARSTSGGSHSSGLSSCFVMDMDPISGPFPEQTQSTSQQQSMPSRPNLSHSHHQHLFARHQHSNSLGSRREFSLKRSDATEDDSRV